MDLYDSDSSGLDDDVQGDYNVTSVLLGYAADEEIEDTISHLGGWPVCISELRSDRCLLFGYCFLFG